MIHRLIETQLILIRKTFLRGRPYSKDLLKEVEASATENAKSSVNWFAVGAGVVSLGSVVMVLLGFGVSLAVETSFGLPHAAVFDSTFELMDLASIAVIELIPAVADVLKDGVMLGKLYKESGPILGVFAGIYLFLTLIGWFYEVPGRSNERKITSAKMQRLHWGMTAKRYICGNALIGLAILLYPLLSLLGLIVFLLAATVLAIAPIVGMRAGNAYIAKWVVVPEKCRSPVSLEKMRNQLNSKPSDAANSPRFADCVSLRKDKELIASGRVVFSTSKAMVLVDEAGKAKRVSTSGVVVEVTDILLP